MDWIQQARGHVAVAVRLRERLHQLERERTERWVRVPSCRRRLAGSGLLEFARVRVRTAAHTTADAATDDGLANLGSGAVTYPGADGDSDRTADGDSDRTADCVSDLFADGVADCLADRLADSVTDRSALPHAARHLGALRGHRLDLRHRLRARRHVCGVLRHDLRILELWWRLRRLPDADAPAEFPADACAVVVSDVLADGDACSAAYRAADHLHLPDGFWLYEAANSCSDDDQTDLVSWPLPSRARGRSNLHAPRPHVRSGTCCARSATA